MKVTIQVELQPFSVPNFVRAVPKPLSGGSGGQSEPPCYPLSDLDSHTLSKMCEEFRDAVFAKSGKEKPPTAG